MDRKNTAQTADIDATVVFAEDHASEAFGSPSGVEETEVAPCSDGTFGERFVFICDFASGGMGNISKACDLQFDRVVAVKTMNDEHARQAQSVESFRRECRLNARLEHPSVVPIYAQGCDGKGHPGVAMKLINGIPLSRFIDDLRRQYDAHKVKPFQERHALISRLEYFLKCCEVIEYCHSLHVVHCDLKPQNILMGRFGELYVVDWGCARNEGEKPDKLSGTPNYMPPEYIKSHQVNVQVDVFALGMILFELITLRHGCKRPPQPGETVESGSHSDIQDSTTRCTVYEPASYRHYLPKLKIPRPLRAIAMKAVDPDPSARYSSVAQLAGDVRHYIYGEEIAALPDNPAQKFLRWIARNRIKSAFAALGLLLLLVGGWGYTAYRAMSVEHEQSESMLRRIRLQTYTDLISTAVGGNWLSGQCQLLLFADNLIDAMEVSAQAGEKAPERIFNNADYASETTAPSGMVANAGYANPVNFDHLVRLNNTVCGLRELPGEKRFVEICRKVANYDLSDNHVKAGTSARAAFNDSGKSLLRLQALWSDGSCYSYPGTFESPDTEQYSFRFGDRAALTGRRIVWSRPFRTLRGGHGVVGRYPMTSATGENLGEARVELKLENLLRPALEANRKDPVHELFFISSDGTVCAVSDNRLRLLPVGSEEEKWIQQQLATLRENHMQQFEALHNGRKHYISGSKLQLVGGTILQMIEADAMKTHRHVDLSL